MKRLALVVFVILFLCPSTHALMIDDFNYGEFKIVSQWDAPYGPMRPFVDVTDTGVAPIGGTRQVWVQKGMDFDPSVATLNNGELTYNLDNDECRGGLSYYDFGVVDFSQESGIAFDVIYDYIGGTSSADYASIQLTDSFGNQSGGSLSLGYGEQELSISGMYSFLFDDDLQSTLDLSSITKIDFTFSGGLDTRGSLGFDNIYTVPIPTPEPSTMLLFGTGLVGLAGFGRKKLKKQGNYSA